MTRYLTLFCRLNFWILLVFSSKSSLAEISNEETLFHSIILPFPDSLEIDSVEVGDTIAVYVSGLDTTFVTYAEEIPDSLIEEAWVINDPHKEMVITFSHSIHEINEGLFGVNLTDFFEPAKAPAIANSNYTYGTNPWEALVDLAPQTIRIFSGASSKFMHPLGSYDAEDDVTFGGYGYNWKEMVPYFDATESGDAAPAFDVVEAQINPAPPTERCTGCEVWMDADFIPRFLEFFDKCASQETFDADIITDPDYQPLYINQLIELIHEVEYFKPDHQVDVIFCVNIESMSATELIDVLDYLFNHEINVVGIELGNESYGPLDKAMMGFEDFDHYYEYITGGNYEILDPGENLELLSALPDDMEEDHNFIETIRTHSAYWTLKIGLPAKNTPNCGAEYDFPLMPAGGSEDEFESGAVIPVHTDPEVEDPCPCYYPNWNLDMLDHYADYTTFTIHTPYNFDAIIFHPYYSTTNNQHGEDCNLNSNWRDIMLQLHEDYDPDHLSDVEIDPWQFTGGSWDYILNTPPYNPSSPDSRLVKAFSEISGIHYPDSDDPLVPGNFKEFVRDRLDISFSEHAWNMLFTGADDDPEDKEVWMTEYNLDDDVILPNDEDDEANIYDDDNIDRFQDFESSVSNTFAHAVMLQNWFLWNIKSNQDPDYRTNYFTRATLQNFLGGDKTMLVTNSHPSDQVGTGDMANCSSTEESPYFIRRANYYAAKLWRTITDNDLQYLNSITTMASLNNNLAPTSFIDVTNKVVYLYYTNVTSDVQKIALDYGSLNMEFGGAGYEIIWDSDNFDGLILDVDQLYSTNGYGALFDINDEYNSCTSSVANENYFENLELTTISPVVSCPSVISGAIPNVVCVRVPPVSMGYLILPFDAELMRLGNTNLHFGIYPNPSPNYFLIQRLSGEQNLDEELKIQIINMYGSVVKELQTSENQAIDIIDLPVGVYNVVIHTGFDTNVLQLVKIK